MISGKNQQNLVKLVQFVQFWAVSVQCIGRGSRAASWMISQSLAHTPSSGERLLQWSALSSNVILINFMHNVIMSCVRVL